MPRSRCSPWPARSPPSSGYLAAGIAALALGTGLYLSAGLGSGPRDSLMVARARTCRWSTARARAILELTAVVAGILLGGCAGAGTLIDAAAIGPAVQWSIRLFPEDLT